MDWFYFWYTKGMTMEEQEELAKKYVPDTRHWIGREAFARYQSIRDITTLVYTRTDDKLQKSKLGKQIEMGDRIYVSNLHVLGAQIDTILKRVQRIHKEGVQLVIISLGYNLQENPEQETEGINTGEDHDYKLLTQTLYEISYQRRKEKAEKPTKQTNGQKKRGAKKRNIHFDSLSKYDQNILKDYINKRITRNDTFKRLYKKMPDGKPLSQWLFKRLIKECKEYEARNGTKESR